MAVYGASKAGLITGSASLEMELHGTGVGVTIVHLGTVDTDMAESALSQNVLGPYFERVDKLGLTKRMSPAKAAAAIVGAVAKDKRDVVVPKDSLPITGLSNAPRRMGRTMARGLTFR